MKVIKSSEGQWMFDAGPHLVTISCHHKKEGACGGCYARAIRVLKELAKNGIGSAMRLMDTLKEEGKAIKGAKTKKKRIGP